MTEAVRLKMTQEEACETENSLIWTFIVRELHYREHCYTEKLKSCKPEELVAIQAKIQLLLEMVRLPEDAKQREE